MERIIFAAIKRSDNCIVFGRDHAECLTKSPEGTCRYIKMQGFLTNKFRFVLRKEAARIAFNAGQIKGYEEGDIIISEELWNVKCCGTHSYDPKLGYIKNG